MDSGGGGAVVVILALVAVAVLGALALNGCDSWAAQREDARAERTRAEAEKVRSEAAAYEQRSEANTRAASERAAIREAAREAGHQRTIETLPIVLAVIAGGLVLTLALVMVWDSRTRQPAGGADNAALLGVLERWRLEAAERDRALWGAIAELTRRRPELPSGKAEVVIWTDKGQE